MHNIEPYYGWIEKYNSSEDSDSPFYGRQYDEFRFSQKIYNYYIHPQWDEFGSDTLYTKILFVDYISGFAIIEFIGEWNDCITNDIMHLKRNIIDHLMKYEINKFILIMENVLNFHGDDDSYYEEWQDEATDEHGWICCINMLEHVQKEMESTGIQYYINFGGIYNEITWRKKEPQLLLLEMDTIVHNGIKQLRY